MRDAAQQPSEVARAFVEARRNATILHRYPGRPPVGMAESYRIQEAALDASADVVAGWKLGRIGSPWSEQVGVDRLAGPIFAERVWRTAQDRPTRAEIFDGGFGAVEAEFVLLMAGDAPSGRVSWTPDEAAALVAEMRGGVEIASSPFAEINDHGPAVTASDFGNNHGLILGPEIADWRERDLAALTCETAVDGRTVGRGSAASIPGGPLGALCFLLGHAAARGRPLKAGQWVSTGAATGVHPVAVGQSARVVFDGYGEIRCDVVAATARASATRAMRA